MAQSDNGSRGVPVPQTTMEVGGSLTDMLFGNQRNDIKLGGKPLSLDNADSELLSAVLGGRMEEVTGRLLGSGAKVDEGTQVLIVKAREKKAEQTFIDTLLATAAAIASEVAKAKDMQAFYAERRMVSDYDMRQEQRAEDRDNKQVDLFGGYMLGTTFYVDRFGGRYDDFGYTYKDGSYKTVAGDLYDAAKQTIFFANGDQYSMPKEIASLPDIAGKVMTGLAMVSVGKDDMVNVLNFLDLAQKLGANELEMDQLSEDVENGRKPTSPGVKALVDKIKAIEGGKELARRVFKDAGAFAFLKSAMHSFFSSGEEAVASAVAEAPDVIAMPTVAAQSSFADLSKIAAPPKNIAQAATEKAENIAAPPAAYGGGMSIAQQALDARFQKKAAEVEGGGLDLRKVPTILRKGSTKQDAEDYVPELVKAHAEGQELDEGTMAGSVIKALGKEFERQAQARGYSDEIKAKRNKAAMGRLRNQIQGGRERQLGKPPLENTFNVNAIVPAASEDTARKNAALAMKTLTAGDDGPETPSPQAVRTANEIAKKVTVSLFKGR